MSFVPVITNAGRAADTLSKIEGNPPIRFANLLLGDGNGAAVTPNSSWTGLVNQRTSIPVSSVVRDLENPAMLWVSAAYQQNTPRGFTIREAALTLLDGTVYAVMSVPDTVMPLAAQGAMRLPTFKIPFIETPATGQIVVFENPGQFATQQFVINLFNELEIPAIPNFATIPQHLAGIAQNLMCHPAGVAAMLQALEDAILPLIPEAHSQSAEAPVLWNAGSRVISARAATKALTGFGRAATDVEAASGVTTPGGYAFPWMTPEQVAALIASRDTSDYAVGRTISIVVQTPSGGAFLGNTYSGAQLNTNWGLQGIGGNLPGNWKCIAFYNPSPQSPITSGGMVNASEYVHDHNHYIPLVTLTFKRDS